MDKEQLRQAILAKLEQQLALAEKAANDARELATHEQSQPETQYDTVGLEASYLAHGQSQRVFDLQQTLQLYRKLPIKSFSEDSEIALTALVCLCYPDDSQRWFFIGPQAGGLEVEFAGITVQVISPNAPISKQLLGLYEGDELTLTGSNQIIEIASLC